MMPDSFRSPENIDSEENIGEYLRSLRKQDIQSVILNSKGSSEYDAKAGILLLEMPAARIFKLRTESGEVQRLHCYAVQVNPYEMVKAHYHEKGAEIYGVPADTSVIGARMYFGTFNADGRIDWEGQDIKPGESFTVSERQPHSLFNKAPEPLLFVVACDPTHVAKGTGAIKEDRVFTESVPEQGR
jgi:hypothetical protein